MFRFVSPRKYCLLNLYPTVIRLNAKYTEQNVEFRELPSFQSHANLKKVVPIFKKAKIYMERTALKDDYGKYSYSSLASGAQVVEQLITRALNGRTGERVVFLCPNDAYYVLAQWAIWMSGQIAVPLSPLHPPEMMEYYINDSKANLIITTPKYAELMDQVGKRSQKKLLIIDDSIRRGALYDAPLVLQNTNSNIGQPDQFYDSQRQALIIYTSGTTGNPKGVVLTHFNLQAQILMLIKAWKWTHEDSILHTLPLHHVHGIVNVLMCPLYVGAKCTMLPKFDANQVWSHLLGINLRPEDRINLYMGVPTIYVKLLQEYDKIFKSNPKMTDHVLQTVKQKIRLMVSGSAPLPTPIFQKWLQITGHKLLERYGMTETGMTLSNVYDKNGPQLAYDQEIKVSNTCSLQDGTCRVKQGIREPGYVGVPLPGVSVRLAEKLHGNQYRPILECTGGTVEEPLIRIKALDPTIIPFGTSEKGKESKDPTGEILIKSDALFKEYYNKPKETKLEFTDDGWFRTGDIGLYNPRENLFKILGRSSVDIIKSGGYKISALHIESILLEHPLIKECAVVALPDLMFGEKVAAIIVLKDDLLELPELTDWIKKKLPDYSTPKVLKFIEIIPRNAMGKVNKKQLVKEIFGDVLDCVKHQNIAQKP